MQAKTEGKPTASHPADALARLFSVWKPTPGIESVCLTQAAGRVLARDAVAELDVPSARTAKMDGIVVRSSNFASDLPNTSSWELGRDYAFADTGAAIIGNFDAVIPIEAVDLSDGYPRFIKPVAPKPGELINLPGATLKAGRLLASSGKILTCTDVALLAMGGLCSVDVLSKPRVSFIPTGSELVSFGQMPAPGQVVDCNSLSARLLLGEYGATAIIHEPVTQDPETLRRVIEAAVAESDIVLVNGKTSKGSSDITKDMIETCGQLTSSWMNSGPGRPVGAGVIGKACVVAVPGPPLGMINVMEYFVSSIIDHWYGIQTHRHTVTATLTKDVTFPADMMMLMNAQLSCDGGRIMAEPFFFKKDLVAALAAPGYFHTPIGTSVQKAGEQVELALFGKRQQDLMPYPFETTE